MLRVLLWLLPVVDVFALPKILAYYRSLGVPVPLNHAKAGLVERWVGYLPVGLVIGYFAGIGIASLVVLVAFAAVGPVELYLMLRGVSPWKFFGGRKPKAVTKIFLLEGYNAVGYYLLGAVVGALVL